MAIFEVETEDSILDIEAKTPEEARKIAMEYLNAPPPEKEKSLGGKALDLYRATRGAARSTISGGIDAVQNANIYDFRFGPQVPFIKGAVKGAVEGFDPENKISGRDILKDIPEAEVNKTIQIPITIGGKLGVKPELQEFEVETDDGVYTVEAENEQEARDIVLEKIQHPGPNMGLFNQVFGDNAPLIAMGIDLLTDQTKTGIDNKIMNFAKEASKITKDDLREIATLDVDVDTLLNLPKRTSEFSLDVLTDPLTPALAGAGVGISRASKIPVVANALEKGVQFIKGLRVAKYFQRGYGAPEEFIKILDDVEVNVNAIRMRSLEVGKRISQNYSLAEDKRIAQIVRGSISSDPKLNAAANEVKAIQDALEHEAKRLGFLEDTYRTKLTRKKLASLRNRQADLARRMEKLNTVPYKDKLNFLANNLEIKGDEALANSLRNLAESYRLKGFDRRKTFQKVIDAIESSNKLPARSKGKLINLVSKAEDKAGEQAFKYVEDIFNIVDSNFEKMKITGLKPLVKYIGKMSRRFPGKAAQLRKLEGESQRITNRIVQHYTDGGKGYLPRLYAVFESGQAREMAKKGISIDDLLELNGDQLALLDNLSPSEFRAFMERVSKIVPGVSARTRKIGGERFLQRKAITDELRKALGEIETASYPFVRGASQVARDVEYAKAFRQIASNKEWALTTDEFKQALQSGLTGQWRTLPDAKNLGDLAGKVVREDIAREILYITRTQGPLAKTWSKALGAWKTGKVILNPSTHFRNMMSNSILLDLSGEDLLTQPALLRKAMNELMNKGKYYDELLDTNLLNSGFFDNELEIFKRSYAGIRGDAVLRNINFADDVVNKLGSLYNSEEVLFKTAKYIAGRRRGLGIKEAAAEAEKWLFNYGKLAPATRFLREFPLGSPFITFTAKALPRIAEVAVKNPAKLYKYKAIFNAIEDQAQRDLGISDEEKKWIKKTFRGTSLILPKKDVTGAPYVMDLSYILPWGDIGEQGGFFGLPPVLTPSGPPMSIIQAGMNKNLYTDQEIRKPLESWYIKAADTIDFIGKALTPSLTPGYNIRSSPFRGGYSFNKIVSAISKTPDYRGRVRALSWTIADTIFGLKAFPVDPNEQKVYAGITAKRNISDRIRNAKRVLRHQGISEEEKARERVRLGRDIERAILDYKE